MKKFSTFTVHLCCMVTMLGVLCMASCSSDSEPASQQPEKKHVQKKKRRPKKKAPEKAAEETVKPETAEYSYDSTGKADPFMPLYVEEPQKQQSLAAPKRKIKPLTPLQKFSIDELSLVAIITSERQASALLQDPSGFGYIVRENTLIGKNDGVIVKIMNNGVIVKEKYYNANGEVETKTSTLKIKHK